MHELHTQRRIEFADTDMAGIVHFARFFIFMETAEHEFLRALGTPVHFPHEGNEVGWPRIAASCEYRSPARLGDVLDIHLQVKRKGRRAMTYAVTFRCGERLVAEGEISSIFCALPWKPAEDEPQERRPRPVPIPGFLADSIETAPRFTEPTADRG
ncbi:MAG: thioesterase family protein [Acidobacteriota bacterium]